MVRITRSILPLLALIIVILIAGCGGESSSGTSTKSDAKAEKIAPDFTTVTLDGERFEFNSLKGNPVIVNFAASWCGPCELEAPILAAGYEKYKDRVKFFGLAVKDDLESQKAFAERHGLKFPIGLDMNGKISFDYQKASKVSISGIPTTYFIDEEGRIVDFFIGPLTEKTFEQKIAQILPQTATTPTTGTQPGTGTQTTGTTPGTDGTGGTTITVPTGP